MEMRPAEICRALVRYVLFPVQGAGQEGNALPGNGQQAALGMPAPDGAVLHVKNALAGAHTGNKGHMPRHVRQVALRAADGDAQN